MTLEEFNILNEQSKRVIIFEAEKIDEIKTEFEKFELFTIDDFFTEVKTSRLNFTRRLITTYKPQELPLSYSYAI